MGCLGVALGLAEALGKVAFIEVDAWELSVFEPYSRSMLSLVEASEETDIEQGPESVRLTLRGRDEHELQSSGINKALWLIIVFGAFGYFKD